MRRSDRDAYFWGLFFRQEKTRETEEDRNINVSSLRLLQQALLK